MSDTRTERLALPGGIEIACRRLGAPPGQGRTALVLVHGWSGFASDFDPPCVLPVARFPILIPELRGHGASTHTGRAEDYTLEALADDLQQVLAALSPAPVHLLGHSMGGMLALRVALAAPERVASLVLMSTSAEALSGIDRASLAQAGRIARQTGMSTLAALLQARADEDPQRSAADRRLEKSLGAESFWHWRRSRLEAMDPEAYEALALAMLDQPSLRARLGDIHCPVLVLVGEEDEAFLSPARVLAEGIPHAQLCVLSRAGHQPQREAPEAWNAALQKHLEAAEA